MDGLLYRRSVERFTEGLAGRYLPDNPKWFAPGETVFDLAFMAHRDEISDPMSNELTLAYLFGEPEA